MNIFEKMGLKNSPEQPAEEPRAELSTEEKTAKVAEIRSKIEELQTMKRNASSSADFGGAGRIAHKKMGDISEKIRELEAELTELGVDTKEPNH